MGLFNKKKKDNEDEIKKLEKTGEEVADKLAEELFGEGDQSFVPKVDVSSPVGNYKITDNGEIIREPEDQERE